MENYKLIYEKDGKFCGSAANVPTSDDKVFAIDRATIESFAKVYSVNGKVMYLDSEGNTTSAEEWEAKNATTDTENEVETDEPVVEEEPTDDPVDEPVAEPVENEGNGEDDDEGEEIVEEE